MVPRFAKRIAKSSLNSLGLSLHDLRKNNDLRVFLPGHLKFLFSRLRINCVIDVGANVGQYGLMLRRIGYQGRIVSIEPVREVFERLCATAKGDADWITLNTACGSVEEERSINISADSPLSSFLTPSANMPIIDARPFERTETVTVKRLESIFDQAVAGLDDSRVFLKTDAQGMDLEVLKGAGQSLSKVQAIQSEVAMIPIYIGVPDYLEFLSYCRSCGFEPTGLYPVVNSPVTGHLVECDIVLARRHWPERPQRPG